MAGLVYFNFAMVGGATGIVISSWFYFALTVTNSILHLFSLSQLLARFICLNLIDFPFRGSVFFCYSTGIDLGIRWSIALFRERSANQGRKNSAYDIPADWID